MSYDPEAHGARCGSCPLRTRREGDPCPPEVRPGARFAIVADYPRHADVEEQRPLAREAGIELNQHLKTGGLHRGEAHVTTVLLCCPPRGDLRKFHISLKARNKKRKAKGAAPWPTPEACCAPRLARELAPFDHVITLGDAAAKAVIPKQRTGALSIRGGPIWLAPDDEDRRAAAADVAADLDTAANDADPLDPTAYTAPASSGWSNVPPDALEAYKGPLRKVLPALHPTFVRTFPRWREALKLDVARAKRLFAPGPTGKLQWKDPVMVFHPSVAQVRSFLAKDPTTGRRKPYAFDFETDSKEPLACTVRCLGIGDEEKVVVIPFASCEPDLRAKYVDQPWRAFYSDAEHDELRRIIYEWALDPEATKVGWNSGYYDALVFQSWLGIPQGRLPGHIDGILVQRLVEPAMSHALGHVGSLRTDAWRWKGGKEGVSAQKDRNLWPYNARDVKVTALVLPHYLARLKEHRNPDLLRLDHEAQGWARGMHTQGMLVDQVERQRLDTHYTAREAHWRAESVRLAHELGGSTAWGQSGPKRARTYNDHNPGSPTHVAKLLYELCGLEPLVYSETSGTASVGDGALRALHYAGALAKDPRLGEYVHAVRRYRAHSKFVSSYMRPLRPPVAGTPRRGIGLEQQGVYALEAALDRDDAVGAQAQAILAAALGDEEARDEAREALRLDDLESADITTRATDAAGSYWDLPERVREVLARQCIVHPDGRIHPDWKTHVVPTGRYATSPNVQNWPGKIRSIIVAGPGRVLVSADASQLELRVAASRWKAGRYLEAFARGWDVHQVTMHAINGDSMWAFPGWVGAEARRFFKDGFKGGTVFDVQRDLAKRVQYAGQYGGAILTVFDVISSAEDKYGRLLYPKLTPTEVAVMVEAWKANCPEFPVGWQTELDFWKQHGFIREEVTGRRWDFPDGEDLNKMVNAPIQGSGAGIVNTATEYVVAQFPFGYAGPGTGLINQGHDALTLEVREEDVDRAVKVLLASLSGTCTALPGVSFEAEAASGKRWKKPAELIDN